MTEVITRVMQQNISLGTVVMCMVSFLVAWMLKK